MWVEFVLECTALLNILDELVGSKITDLELVGQSFITLLIPLFFWVDRENNTYHTKVHLDQELWW